MPKKRSWLSVLILLKLIKSN